MRVSVVIPTFNEWGNIQRLIPRLTGEIKNSKVSDFEIIVVDDSSDQTGEKLKKMFGKNKRIRVVIRKNSNGLAGAILKGIKISKGDVVVGMDADFNHDPGILSEMINMAQDNGFVLASRFIRGGGMDDKARYLFTKVFNILLKKLLGFPTTDNMSGYYAMQKRLLDKMPLNNIYRGYGDYHLRLVWAVKLLGTEAVEIPVYYKKREYGKSKSNLFKMLGDYSREAIRLGGIKYIDEI